jgi:hypothetical protein
MDMHLGDGWVQWAVVSGQQAKLERRSLSLERPLYLPSKFDDVCFLCQMGFGRAGLGIPLSFFLVEESKRFRYICIKSYQ